MTCKKCGKDGFKSPGEVRRHYVEAGHPKRRKKREAEPAAPSTHDRELLFINILVETFDVEIAEETLTQDAYDRVLAYLTSRYGSQPVAAE